MAKLNKTQIEILASASNRDDGRAERPSELRPSGAAKAAAKLIELGLVQEVRAKEGTPIWRQDEQGKTFGLVILKAGRSAAKLAEESGAAQVGEGRAAVQRAAEPTGQIVKSGSKRDLVIGLLQKPEGTTIEDLMAATGWLPHTTRAALSGLRKAGLTIERNRDADARSSVYRLVETKTPEAA